MQLLIFSFPQRQLRFWWFFPSFPLRVVGSNGLGPSTSRLSGVCSNQLSYEPVWGGGNRVRTDDPLLAGQVLYQLSYTPFHLAFVYLAKINAPHFLGSMLLLKTNKKKMSFRIDWELDMVSASISFLPKRRWSSRTFRYGYLVTTSPQSLVLP